jgi:hypothetical protein
MTIKPLELDAIPWGYCVGYRITPAIKMSQRKQTVGSLLFFTGNTNKELLFTFGYVSEKNI